MSSALCHAETPYGWRQVRLAFDYPSFHGPFDMPFGRPMVQSEVEGLTALRSVERLPEESPPPSFRRRPESSLLSFLLPSVLFSFSLQPSVCLLFPWHPKPIVRLFPYSCLISNLMLLIWGPKDSPVRVHLLIPIFWFICYLIADRWKLFIKVRSLVWGYG